MLLANKRILVRAEERAKEWHDNQKKNAKKEREREKPRKILLQAITQGERESE